MKMIMWSFLCIFIGELCDGDDDIQSLKFKGESERFGLNLGLLHLKVSFSALELIIVRNQI